LGRNFSAHLAGRFEQKQIQEQLIAHSEILKTERQRITSVEQRRRFLPRVARGEISAFALTETKVGSDPAKMETQAEPTPDGVGQVSCVGQGYKRREALESA
jgi:alkylation response protein AidB-like acyl-CoA dehydrogenase